MKRRLFFWLIIALAFWFAISQFAEIEKIIRIVTHGRWQWVMVAVALEVVYYFFYVKLYQVSYRSVGIEEKMPHILAAVLACNFVNALAPTAGTAGIALLADDAKLRGHSAARAAAGALLAWIVNYGAFLVFLAIALAYLSGRGKLQEYEIIAALIFALITVLLGAALVLANTRRSMLIRLLIVFQRLFNKVVGWFGFFAPLPDDWVKSNSGDFIEASHAISQERQSWLKLIALSCWMHLLNVLILYSIFLAFYQSVPFLLALSIFSINILFIVVSPTPQGIGVVEGIAVVVLASLSVPLPAATVIVLAFRGISFWLPLAIGFLMLRHTKSFRIERESVDDVCGVEVI